MSNIYTLAPQNQPAIAAVGNHEIGSGSNNYLWLQSYSAPNRIELSSDRQYWQVAAGIYLVQYKVTSISTGTDTDPHSYALFLNDLAQVATATIQFTNATNYFGQDAIIATVDNSAGAGAISMRRVAGTRDFTGDIIITKLSDPIVPSRGGGGGR